MSPPNSPKNNSQYIGAMTGLLVGITLQPLEILKTNLMINPTKSRHLEQLNPIKTTIYVAKEVYHTEGIKGFWRGLLPALTKLTLSASLYFYSLEKLENIFSEYFKNRNKDQLHFLTSSLSRAISGILTNPIQVVRTRFEVLGFSQYNNTFDAFMKIYQKEGLAGFSAGVIPTTLRDVPFAGIYFTIYMRTKRFLEKTAKNMSLLTKSFISGMMAGVVSTILTNPFDIIRARMQYGVFMKEESKRYKNVREGVRKIYRLEGLQGFMKGLGPRLMRKPLSNSLSFVIYEGFHKAINKKEAF